MIADPPITVHRDMNLLYLRSDANGQKSLPVHLLRHGVKVETVQRLEKALGRLKVENFDAVLVDLTAHEFDGVQACQRLAHEVPDVPVVAVTDPDGEALAVDAIAAGAQDYLINTRVETGDLKRRIRAALARRVREVSTLQDRLRANLNSLQHLTREDEERSRYFVTRGVWAAAVLPNGEPDRENLTGGLSVAMNRESITVEFAGNTSLPVGRWVIGMEHDDGAMRFASVEASDANSGPAGSSVTARFLAGERDLFCERNLIPVFDAQVNCYTTGLSTVALKRWTSLGVLQPEFFDRVLVCPQCNAVSTVRSGCRVCGSARLRNVKLMHHFACAHVGHMLEFEREGRIMCPKCRTRDLVVGADFEYIDGPFECQQCSWSDANFEWVAQCLACQFRCPIHHTVEQELVAYHVERLDPLAHLAPG